MSSITPDSLRTELEENAIKAGNPVKTSTGAKGTGSALLYVDTNVDLAQTGAVTASKPVYINSSSVPATGSFPFAIPVVASSVSTSEAHLDVTGYSSLSGGQDLSLNFVTAAAATAHTVNGYIRIKVTDSGGNLTNGYYYIPFGTLT